MDSIFVYSNCCNGYICINESCRYIISKRVITLPIAISMRITKGFKQLIILSVIIGEFSVIAGLVLAFYMNISPGGVIVVLLVLILAITMMYQRLKVKSIKGVAKDED